MGGCAAIALTSAALAQGVPSARYQCSYFGRFRYEFTILNDSQYTLGGSAGSYSVSGGVITFSGGGLNGHSGIFRPGAPPRIGMYGTGGRETENCQPAR